MASSAAYYLTYQIEKSDEANSKIRARAREIELRVIAALDRGFQLQELKSKSLIRVSPRVRKSTSELFGILDTLVLKLKTLLNAQPQSMRAEQIQTVEPWIGTFVQRIEGIMERNS